MIIALDYETERYRDGGGTFKPHKPSDFYRVAALLALTCPAAFPSLYTPTLPFSLDDALDDFGKPSEKRKLNFQIELYLDYFGQTVLNHLGALPVEQPKTLQATWLDLDLECIAQTVQTQLEVLPSALQADIPPRPETPFYDDLSDMGEQDGVEESKCGEFAP